MAVPRIGRHHVADPHVVAVSVAAVEGHHDVGAVTVEAAADGCSTAWSKGAPAKESWSASPVRPESANRSSRPPRRRGRRRPPAARPGGAADAAGRDRYVLLDLARLAAARRHDGGPGAARRRVHQQRAAAERLVVGVGDHDEQGGRRRHATERTKDSISVTMSSGTSNIGKWLRASSRRTENHGWVAAYSCCAASTSSAAGWA